VRAIRTGAREHPADLAVVCIGVVPNTEWLEGSAVERDGRGGIVVDDGLATTAEDVLAAGDCASVPFFDGSRQPEQLWYTARAQGRVAGRALAGERVKYDRGVWFNSAKLMDVEYTTAGLVNMRLEDERNWFFEERGPVRSTTRITLAGDRVAGFNLLGRRWDHEVLARWIVERRTLAFTLDHLHEALFDTEFVPPLRVPPEARKRSLDGPAPNPFRKESVAYPLR
jgi:NADPH-dependent 2,4-dienoyl-CoA reductase/sulfur reductase-like enzyme